MMNLRGMANSVTTGINPNIPATLRINDGFTVDDYGKQIPKFSETEIIIQPQSLSSTELFKLDLISKQGQFISVYAYGPISAKRRWLLKGNEQLIFAPYGEPDAVTWNVDRVLESYGSPNWVRLLLWRS